LLGVRALIPDGTATAGAPQPPAGFVLPSDEPFPGATATTLRNAEEGVSFQVLRPSDPLASDDSITGVWMNTQNQQVAIDYAPGVRLYLTVVDPPKDPGGDAKELAAEMGGRWRTCKAFPLSRCLPRIRAMGARGASAFRLRTIRRPWPSTWGTSMSSW